MASIDLSDSSKPKRIFMWVNPRSLSTVIEKCIGSMDGVQVWHEPYISCYFNRHFHDPETFVRFPNAKVVADKLMNAKELFGSDRYEGGNLSPISNFTCDWVKEQLQRPIEKGKTFMFIKDAAAGIDGNFDKLPNSDAKHTFLIRHPHRCALSMRRYMMECFDSQGNIDNVDISRDSIFVAWEKLSPDPIFKLWKHVRENIDPNPIVIDADDLQSHPEQIMGKYCEGVGIPFKKDYLSWEAGDESMKFYYGCLDQIIWGMNTGVYDTAFLSSSFQPLKSGIPDKVPEKCQGYVDEFMEGYKVMYETRIKPE